MKADLPVIIVLLIPIIAMIVGYFIQRLKSEERLRLIEKGLPPPPQQSLWDRLQRSQWERAADFRVAGLICVAVGAGLVIMFTAFHVSLPDFPAALIAIAVIPLLIGAALLYEYQIRSRELGPRPAPPPREP